MAVLNLAKLHFLCHPFRDRNTLFPTAGSATTTFLFVPFAAAVAFIALLFAAVFDLVSLLPLVVILLVVEVAVATRPPRLGFVITVLALEVEDCSELKVVIDV